MFGEFCWSLVIFVVDVVVLLIWDVVDFLVFGVEFKDFILLFVD